MRTFVAVRCGDAARKKLCRLATSWAAGDKALRVPHENDFHMTLHFLGNTDERDVARIGQAIGEAVKDATPFGVSYQGIGAFPRPERPRVLWVGLDPTGAAMLAGLAGAIHRALGDLGYPPERRKFHPHVTMARVHRKPQPSTLSLLTTDGKPSEFAQDWVSEVKLILSDPDVGACRYIDLTTQHLSG